MNSFVISDVFKVINIQIISRIVAFITSIVLARNLGPDLYGKYATLIAEIGFVMIPISSGLSILVIREVSKRISTNMDDISNALFWPSFHIKLATILLFVTLLILVAFFKFSVFDSYFYFCIAIVYFKSHIIYKSAIINGIDKPILAQFLSILLAPLLLLFFILTVFFIQKNISISDAISCLFISSLISWLVVESIFFTSFKIKTSSKSSLKNGLIFYKSLTPFFLMALFSSFNNETAIILISMFHDPAEVAFFSIGLQAALVLLIIQNSINSVLMPKISINRDDILYCNQVIRSSVRFGGMVSGIILTIYIIFAEIAIKYIYGIDFLGAYQIVVILAVAQFLNVVIGPTGVDISGQPIRLNSGGNPSFPVKANPEFPEEAEGISDESEDSMQKVDSLQPEKPCTQGKLLAMAAKSGAPFCELC